MKIKPMVVASIYGAIFVSLVILATTVTSSKLMQSFVPALATITNSSPLSEDPNIEIEETTTRGMRHFQFWSQFVDIVISFSLFASSSLSSLLYSLSHTKKSTLSMKNSIIGGAISAGIANTTGIAIAALFAYWLLFSGSFFAHKFNMPIFTFYPLEPSMYGFLSLASDTGILRTGVMIFIRGTVVGSIIGLLIFFPVSRYISKRF